MSNDEIFESLNGGKDAVTSVKHLEWFTAHFVLSAMDAAREDEAIRFAEWTAVMGYDYKIDSKWAKFYKNQGGGDYDTTELYQLFKKQNQ